MVHATSAIAIAVLALNAATTLARPVEIETDLAAREFDPELDARDVEFGNFEYEAREFEDEVDARDFDFGDYSVEERDFEIEDEVVERAPTTTTASVKAPTTTTTTHITKPTGKDGKEIKNGKETKTVVVTVLKTPKQCKKLSLMARLKLARQKKAFMRSIPLNGPLTPHQKHSLQRHLEAQRLKELTRVARVKARKAGREAAATPTASSSASGTSAAKATDAKTATATANWSSITPPPKPEGFKVVEKKSVGKKDKVTTIMRTVTAAPTPCPLPASKLAKRDLEDLAEVLERSYSYEDLD